MITNNEFCDFIEIYNDSVPQELCDEFVKWFDICSDKNFTMYNMPFSTETTKARHGLRSDEAIGVPAGIHHDHYPVASQSLPSKICNAFWDVLTNCCNDYMEKYDMMNTQLSCYNFKIHKVKQGQGYHVWHYETDALQGRDRILAWMTYLNIPEKGGETEFLYQSKRIMPEVGKTLIWPAHFTHLHRGNPPLKGEKIYVTGWFER